MNDQTLEQLWAEAKRRAADDQLNIVPDGTYEVTAKKALVGNSKSSGRPMWTVEFRIIGAEATGRLIWHRRMLDASEQWPWLASDLAKFGVDLVEAPTIESLQPYLEGMLDQMFEVTVKTNGEFRNVTINKRIDGATSDVPF